MVLQNLLHDGHRLDGLRLGGVHVSSLARSLGLADQLGRVATRGLGAGERARRLHILPAARSLHILTTARSLDLAARSLNILAAARRLHVLTTTRGLNILPAARRLNI